MRIMLKTYTKCPVVIFIYGNHKDGTLKIISLQYMQEQCIHISNMY